MKRFISFVWLFCALAGLSAQTNEELLKQLDEAIENKSIYQAQRFATADSLSRLARVQQGDERLNTLYQLYQTYLHFQTDSALSVLTSLTMLPEYATDIALQRQTQLRQAQIYGMMGLYSDAFKMMKSVDLTDADSATMLVYYNMRYSVLGWAAEYAEKSVPSLAHNFKRQAINYHDSIKALEPDPLNRLIVQSNHDYDRGLYEAAIEELQNAFDQCDASQKIYIYSNLSQAYGKLGREEEELHYLILTALSDIQAGITEYMALPLLAKVLNERGDVDRAFNYLYCALGDANQSKANLRAMKVSEFFPIIQESRQKQAAQQRLYTYGIIALLLLWAIVLTFVIVGLLRLNRKLKNIKSELASANNQLKTNNVNLSQMSEQKSKYLKSYLTLSRQYLASAESFQHQMLNLLQTRHLEELQKQLKSTKWTEDEEVRFYNEFDMAFLNLYPNFVEKFNALLKPEAQIIPKKGELLTTELRIFALIRMGEEDSARIAKFLNYSLTTIYNYRSRVRNNAVCDKEKFEEIVAQL